MSAGVRGARAWCLALTLALAAACSGGSASRPAERADEAGPSSVASATPSVAPPAPATTTAPPATGGGPAGEFTVAGTRIVDPAGRTFVPYGTNVNGPDSFFSVATKGRAEAFQRQWGYNIVRVVTCLPQGCHGQHFSTNNDLDGIVTEYTGRSIVAMIDYHQLDFGAAASPADLAAAVAFWTGIARRYQANPYVWFNLYNEPEANFNDATAGGTVAARWRAMHQPVIDAIRATGARNPIVIDDAQAGMGAGDWWQIGVSPASDSGILTAGKSLVDPLGKLIFSVHAYDVWGFPNDNDPTCRTRYTDAQRDARFRAYVDRVHQLDVPLLIGELGFRPTDLDDRGVSLAGEVGGHPPCGSTQRLAAETAYRVAPATGIGIIVWHGFDLVSTGAQEWALVGEPPSNLTPLGRLHFEFGRQLPR